MTKEPLDFNLYDQYEINPHNVAYKFTYTDITMTRAGELEDELSDKKFQIVHSEIKSSTEGKFNLYIIAIEPKPFTF